MRLFHHSILFIFLATAVFSCKKRGCTDTEALNYDQTAKKDDHGCYYFWIGQKYGGGRVFYIDQTKKHGLISAEIKIPNTAWGCTGSSIVGAQSTFVGTGLQNTSSIVANCNDISAAFRCSELDTLGFNDWYLPSKEELKGLYESLGKIGQGELSSDYYWSSSENDSSSAWTIMFANGAAAILPKSVGYSICAIRSF